MKIRAKSDSPPGKKLTVRKDQAISSIIAKGNRVLAEEDIEEIGILCSEKGNDDIPRIAKA